LSGLVRLCPRKRCKKCKNNKNTHAIDQHTFLVLLLGNWSGPTLTCRLHLFTNAYFKSFLRWYRAT
jgi:hypothetical protein